VFGGYLFWMNSGPPTLGLGFPLPTGVATCCSRVNQSLITGIANNGPFLPDGVAAGA
jgi:hypothetical protein